jgi:hypothetical protein
MVREHLAYNRTLIRGIIEWAWGRSRHRAWILPCPRMRMRSAYYGSPVAAWFLTTLLLGQWVALSSVEIFLALSMTR